MRTIAISGDYQAYLYREMRRTGGSTADECCICMNDPAICGCFADQEKSDFEILALQACEELYDQTVANDYKREIKAGDLELTFHNDEQGHRMFVRWVLNDKGQLIRHPLSDHEQKTAQRVHREFLDRVYPRYRRGN